MEPRAEPRLLIADQEAIERGARALRRGTGFVIVVCAPELSAEAWVVLEAKVGPLRPTMTLRSGEEMLAVLVDIAGTPEGESIFMLAVPRDARAAMVTLNLHREKLLSGAPVVLWLDDAETLEALREIAPDAWAFRTTVILVRGDSGIFLQLAGEEGEELVQARKRLKRAKNPTNRAIAGGQLADILRRAGKSLEAEQAIKAALETLRTTTSDADLELRVKLMSEQAVVFRDAGKGYLARRALDDALQNAELLPLAKGAHSRTYLLACKLGPFGHDRAAVLEALNLGRGLGVAPAEFSQALLAAGRLWEQLGDLPMARRILLDHQRLLGDSLPSGRTYGLADLGVVAAMAGDFVEADMYLRKATTLAVANGMDTIYLQHQAFDLLLLQGEVEAARRCLDGIKTTEQAGRQDVRLAQLMLTNGHLDAALCRLREAREEAMLHSKDQLHMLSCWVLAELLGQANDAEVLPPLVFSKAVSDIDAAENEASSIANGDPLPWYPIVFRSLRAQTRALDPLQVGDAVVLSQEAFAMTQSQCADLVPRNGRFLAECLISATRPEDAICILRDVEAEAVSRGMLAELAAIRATQIRAFVQQSASREAIDERMRALREALESTDSRRITAETLLTLATNLPPKCEHPDVLALAEETQVAFFEMPMPSKEARAIETAGDALLARGRPDEAKRRYSAAKARLERFGLALRIPLLERKLASAQAS